MKKIMFYFYSIMFFLNLSILCEKPFMLYDGDEAFENLPILVSYSELVQYYNNAYDYLDNYYLTIDTTYAPIPVKNYSQVYLKNTYNQLSNARFDLNDDGIIDSNDNIGQNGGICQPTACAMALQYLIEENLLSYTPRLTNDSRNINNIFYQVVDSYISNGWSGSTSPTSLAYQSLNTIFNKINSAYSAKLITSNFYSTILNANIDRLPCIGHINMGHGDSHAAVICGFYTITVHYTFNLIDMELEFIWYVINDGWINSGYYEGCNSQALFDMNYSYIFETYLYAVTTIN